MLCKKTQNGISGFLNWFDRFEEPIQINLKGENTSTSVLGGTLSLLIIGFLTYQATIQTIGMINKEDPQVIQINEFQNDPAPITLNKANNFNLIVYATLGDYFVDLTSSVISFTGHYYEQIRHPNGTVNDTVSQLLWAPCNKSDFSPPLYSEKAFEDFSLNNAYCASGVNRTDRNTGQCPADIVKDYPNCVTPLDVEVGGVFFSSKFTYLYLAVHVCDDDDAMYISGLECSPNAATEANSGEELTLYMGFTNNYIDPSNYSVPNQTFFDYIDWSIRANESANAELYIDKETVRDFDSLFWTDTYAENTYYSLSADKMREQDLNPGGEMLLVGIQRSKLNKITKRTYVKILDVMSSVGGLSEPLFLIGSVLALWYARCKYLLVLSNQLYDFEQYQQTIALRKIALDNFAKGSPPDSTNNLRAKSRGRINIKEYFDALKAKSKLKYDEITYMKHLFRGLFMKPNAKEKLARKAKKKVMKDLDIGKIIEKLKDVDKLKALLLNKHQLETFKYIKKKKISLRDRGLSYKESLLISPKSPTFDESKVSVIPEEREGSKYERLYNSYKQLKEDKNTENSRLNGRLLNMLDEDILNVFSQVDTQNNASAASSTNQFEQLLKEIQQDRSSNIPLNVADL